MSEVSLIYASTGYRMAYRDPYRQRAGDMRSRYPVSIWLTKNAFLMRTIKHGGTPAMTPCTGYCRLGARAPSLVCWWGAPTCSARCLFAPSRTKRARWVGLPLHVPLPQHTEPLASLKNAPSRASRRAGVQAPPTRSPRLGPLESPGRFLTKWLPPCLRQMPASGIYLRGAGWTPGPTASGGTRW